jgi:hypothetical protein
MTAASTDMPVADNGSAMSSLGRIHEAAELCEVAEEHGGAAPPERESEFQHRFELNEDPSFWKDNSVQVNPPVDIIVEMGEIYCLGTMLKMDGEDR